MDILDWTSPNTQQKPRFEMIEKRMPEDVLLIIHDLRNDFLGNKTERESKFISRYIQKDINTQQKVEHMNSDTEKLFDHIGEINRLNDVISGIKELAYIWEDKNINSIIRISLLMNEIMNLGPEKWSEFKKSVSMHELFSDSVNSQKKLIAHEGIEKWHSSFQKCVADFIENCFFKYIYYTTYELFSDNTRDNSLKTKIIKSLTDKKSRLLEIGPGTGPLIRRLINDGYNVYAIEYDQNMIDELIKRCPHARERVIHADFFKHDIGRSNHNVIYVESGLILVNNSNKSKPFIELMHITYKDALIILEKVFNALENNGLFLVGSQGAMRKAKISHDMYMALKTKKKKDSINRDMMWYRKKTWMSRKQVLYHINYDKPTIEFEEFVSIVKKIGFREVTFSEKQQWLILKK